MLRGPSGRQGIFAQNYEGTIVIFHEIVNVRTISIPATADTA